MSPTRRVFLLKSGAMAGSAITLTLLGSACGSNPSGPSEDGPDDPGGQQPTTFDVDLTAYPALADDGSVVVVSGTPRGSIFVTRTGGQYYALSRICTHQGCTVGATTPTLNCPCHGSMYNLMGSVVGGPAPASLQSWPTSVAGTTRTIDFS
jgi:Rieske Fe-S protein